MITNLGRWTEADIDSLLASAQKLPTPGARVGFLSKSFMGLPYVAHTLVGSETESEQLVVNLAGVDCFTLLDYLDAMRQSASYGEFVERLKDVRYRRSAVAFRSRNHFFSDWPAFRADSIEDITALTGGTSVVPVEKVLNLKSDGGRWLQGIEPFPRRITYIPTERLDEMMLAGLRTGDYIGIYSDADGLDVSHVGVLVKGPFMSYLRHASSVPEKMRVLDDELLPYLSGRPGLIIYRPK